jgi:hypothetical protein
MKKQEFIAKMAIAYMQHHGCAPTLDHLSDWENLWRGTLSTPERHTCSQLSEKSKL